MKKTSAEHILNTKKIRKDFPILEREINGYPLIYFDNAATAQKPRQVIDAVGEYYLKHNSNVHRGIHTLSEEATDLYEQAREEVALFIGAKSEELVFTSGTTQGLNIAAYGIKDRLKPEDEVLTTIFEHHSSFLPWQNVCKQSGAKLKIVGESIRDPAKLNTEEIAREMMEKVSAKTAVLVLSQVSNVLGEVFPVMRMCAHARKVNPNILIVIDGAQAIPHIPIKVKKLNCDFYAFSGHKMLGPTGIGGLWINKNRVEDLEPKILGGGMIKKVEIEKSVWAKTPYRYEAGTPHIAGAVGLAEAVRYLNRIGMKNVMKHSQLLTNKALDGLQKFSNVEIVGTKKPNKRVGLISFFIKEAHAHDIASILDSKGIAVRGGQHCAMPLHQNINLPASVRASFYIYNTPKEIEFFLKSLGEVLEILT